MFTLLVVWIQHQPPQQQPKPSAGTEASKWKSTPPPPQPTATPAPYKAAALKGKKNAPPAHKPPTTRPRKVLSTRQLQVLPSKLVACFHILPIHVAVYFIS
ncbi:hypothetical protein G6F37_014243 [Rhizopus arrhizus]|nr:hypothetical protein G6F37_014243 [Rhizopus arrhizus]